MGVMAREPIAVAMTLASSWNPLVWSNTSTITTTATMRKATISRGS